MAANFDNNNDLILVSETSSDDDDDDDASNGQIDFSIKGDILEAKRLLLQAEQRSNMTFDDTPSPYQRYGLSCRVWGSDILRDREFSQMSDALSILKTRLSAERIFNLGPPQTSEEREIFDDILWRYSAVSLAESAHLVQGGGSGTASVNRNQEGGGTYATSLQNPQANLESNAERNSGSRGNSSVAMSPQRAIPNLVSDAVNSERNISGSNNAPEQISSTLSLQSTSIPSSSTSHASSITSPPKYLLNNLLKLKEYLNLNIHEHSGDTKHPAPIIKLLQKLSHSLSQSPVDEDTSTPSNSQRKRQREESVTPPNSSKKPKQTESDEEEEACSICFEAWSSGGEHRICCLKCGHLFGLSCITKWIEQAKSCPQCKVPAKKSDIRSIFSRRLTVEDTSQRDRAMRMLEEERQAKRSLEHKEAIARKQLNDLVTVNSSLKSRVNSLLSELSTDRCAEVSGASSSSVTFDPDIELMTPSSSQSCPTKKYHLLARVNITQEGNCRVFEFNADLGMVIVSTKSSNPLFRGFGIKTLSRDFRCLSYQPLHSGAIRDMSFRPATFDGTLLSCGMDKVIQLTSVTSKCVIQKYTLSGSAWCCAWNTLDTHLFYAGMERGTVKEFDIRRTDSHVQEVVQLGGPPITSLSFWNGTDQESRYQGLILAHVRELIFKGKLEDSFSAHFLHNSNASITDMNVHDSGHFLVSNRPGSGNAFCKYEVCKLKHSVSDSGDFTVNSSPVSTWDGSNLQVVMSRNTLLSVPEMTNHILAATANHSNNTVNLWDVTRKQQFQVLSAFDKALDIKSIRSGQQDLLGILCDSDLLIYKWR